MFKFLEKSNQEIFNRAWQHRIEQKAFSMSKRGDFCMYRNENGLKCSIGDQILDEEYIPKMEGRAINIILVIVDIPENKIDFLQALQRCHDTAAHNNNLLEWTFRQKQVAQLYNLTVPEEG